MSILKMGLGAIAVSALVLSAANPVAAAPAAKSDAVQLRSGSTGGMTDVSAQRRYRGGGNGGAAAAAAFAGIVGTAIAVGAARSAYDDGYGYYGGGPAYGYGSPYDAYNSYGGPVYGVPYGGDYSRDRSGAVYGSGYRRPENNPSR